MAFDLSDIRTEMARADVRQDFTTLPITPPPEQSIVPVTEEPTPLEKIAPGELGNEINMENPPNFEELNRAHPLPPLRQLSKRQAGVDPECNPTTKYKRAGEPSRTPFILDPDFPSEDDSSGDDFELVARSKKVISSAVKKKKRTSKAAEETNPELDISLVVFLLDLKQGKAKISTEAAENLDDESTDEEMTKEFSINKLHDSASSSDELDSSDFSSSECDGAQTDSESDSPKSSKLQSESENDTAVEDNVAAGVTNTDDNT